QGENFGHAIFEALASGRPVMISDQTPWRNLAEKKAGWDIPLDQPKKFEQACHQAVHWNQAEFDEWSTAALSLAKNLMEQTELKSNYFKLFS
ncbi:MAG: glycosyltransferase, partial [Chitinophagaceae bacterium]